MIGLLQQLLDGIICFIETGIILFANLCIRGIAATVRGLLSLLPNMPDTGSIPSWVTDGYHYAAYWFPVDWALTLGGTFVTFYIAWLGVSIVLRWGKIISGAA